jgi:hypothetical protein
MTKTFFVSYTRIGGYPARGWLGKINILVLLLLCCALSLPAFSQAPAAQQSPASNSADLDLLDILLENGTITQQQYDALKLRYVVKHEMGAEPSSAQAAQSRESVKKAKPVHVVTAMDNAVGFHAGNFDVTFSGDIDGFYVHDRPDRSANTTCILCLASNGSVSNSSIRNGLLPGDLTIKIATKEQGYDVAFTFGIWPGISNLMTSGAGGLNLNSGNPSGFGTSGIDFRQQYLTVGKPRLGTFKFGRDLGFLGQEALFNDLGLLGVGTTNGNVGPGSVSLGRIGSGYVYTDWIPQISYTSPSYHGLQASGGIFTPMDDVVSTTLGYNGSSVDTPAYSAPLTGNGQPQLQFKLTYAAPKIGILKSKFWANYLTQSMEANTADIKNDPLLELKLGEHVRANAVDYGTKLTLGPAEFVAYGYNGWGLGTEGLFFLATSPSGATRPSQGYFLQGTYTFRKWTLGASYGQSNLGLADRGENLNSLAVTRFNGSYIGQARYALTTHVNLLGEYTHMRSESQARVVSTSDSFALGSVAFF